jgi:hypothetical protein
MTVNQIHFERHQDMIRELVNKGLIHGLGISLNNPTEKFIELVKTYPNAVIHVINGILSPSDVGMLADNDLKILILGYKLLRRGVSHYVADHENIECLQYWLKENLEDMLNHFKVISFDNLAIEQLDVKNSLFFGNEERWKTFYMGDDGTHTMYIDTVAGKYSKNSCMSQKERYLIKNKTVIEMFNDIRQRYGIKYK